MTYPTPPGGGNPYLQPPPQEGWPQQGPGPLPPMPPQYGAPRQAPYAQAGSYPQPGPYAAHPAAPPTACPPGAPLPAGGGGRTVRKVAGTLLGIVGALGLLGGGMLATHAYNNSRQNVPNAEAYGPVLWRNETAETLFPATVGEPPDYRYEVSDEELAHWRRMGISEDTSCSAGLSGETRETAERLGCEAVLRATYVDLTGEMVATVAVIVMPAGTDATEELGQYVYDQSNEDLPDAAVMPYKVPGTLAAKWDADGRNGMGGSGIGGNLPYVVAVTTGAVDGRLASHLPDEFNGYGIDTEDRKPWMDEAESLSGMFRTNIMNLER